MLIDASYFSHGARQIRNSTLGTFPIPNQGVSEVSEVVEAYIDENQERFLTSMLGRTLGNKVHTYLVAKVEDEMPKVEHYDILCGMLRESFADYVFYHYLRDVNEEVMLTGVVRLKTVNTYVHPIRKQVDAWNRMVERNRAFRDWAKSCDCPLPGIEVADEMITKINVFNL